MDDHSARLSFAHRGQSVACLMRFNLLDEIAECVALRYLDATTQQPWICRYTQYRRRHGVLVPTVGEAAWVIDGQRQPYARFVVRELEYAPLQPF